MKITLLMFPACLTLLLSCLCPAPVFGAELQVWPDKTSGVYPNEFAVSFRTNDTAARVFWTRSPDESPAKGEIFATPIPVTRSGTISFFAFTPEPDPVATQIQKVLYFVESKTGYEHLRISKLIPQQNKAIIKNYSHFPIDLAKWNLQSQFESLLLEPKQLQPDEEITISLHMPSQLPQIYLRSPDGSAKQLAAPPPLRADEEWRCESRRSSSCKVFSKI